MDLHTGILRRSKRHGHPYQYQGDKGKDATDFALGGKEKAPARRDDRT